VKSFVSLIISVVAVLGLGLGTAGSAGALPEGTMTWGVHITLAPRWLDPGETEGIATPFMVLYALHDALVKPMPGGLYTPCLAESFTPSKDGLSYEFVIRKGARPYFSMGEALATYLQAVGIRTKVRIMERAAMTTAWRERTLKGVIVGITGAGSNASTRLEAYASKGGAYTAGTVPEVEDLFQRQVRELDAKKREALLHQIQQILYDRTTHIPIYELAFIWGVGPRVEEPGINLVRSFAYSAPLEDVKLKRP
jgi:ABC-type transport system substrate-binding protein